MEIEKILTTVGTIVLGFAALFGAGAAFINGFNPVAAVEGWVNEHAPWVNQLVQSFSSTV